MSEAQNTNTELMALASDAAAADAATQPKPEPMAEEAADQETGAVHAEPVMSAEDEAAKLVDVIAWAVEKIFPVLGYKPETKVEAAQKLAPLLVKYNVRDTVIAKWGAEFEAGMFFAGLGYASYLAVKASKQPQEPEAKPSWWRKFFAK